MIEKQSPKNLIELIKTLEKDNIPKQSYIDHIDLFLEQKARINGVPLTGSFELTPFCNLDCKMCYVHLSNLQYDKNNLLPVEIWKDLIKQTYNAGMRNASLTGGECLTYPGFDDIYLFLYSLNVIPSILSNGILLDKKRIEFFKQYPPKMIQVTVYGSSEDAYEKVTGHRVFQTVYNNLLLLKENKIPVKMSITPNSFLKDDIWNLLNLLQKMKIPYNINANLIPPRANTGRLTHDLTIDEYVEIFKYRSAMNLHSLTNVDPSELPDENHGKSKKYGLICGAGRSSFGIKYDGAVTPCLSLGDISVNPFESGFLDAWKKINTLANNYPLPEECGDCIYHDRCLPCIAMHLNAPQPGHCDPRICERTKKLVSAGFIPIPDRKNMVDKK